MPAPTGDSYRCRVGGREPHVTGYIPIRIQILAMGSGGRRLISDGLIAAMAGLGSSAREGLGYLKHLPVTWPSRSGTVPPRLARRADKTRAGGGGRRDQDGVPGRSMQVLIPRVDVRSTRACPRRYSGRGTRTEGEHEWGGGWRTARPTAPHARTARCLSLDSGRPPGTASSLHVGPSPQEQYARRPGGAGRIMGPGGERSLG